MKFTDYCEAQNDASMTVGPPPRHILVYGPPKSGKTALIGKLATKYRLWYIDLEDSIKTLANPQILAPEFRDNIELIRVPDKQTYPVGIETVLKIFKGGPAGVCHEHGKVRCPICTKEDKPRTTINLDDLDTRKDIVVLESYSQLADSCMAYIMRKAIAAENWENAKPGWDEYGKQGLMMANIGTAIQTAPFNIVVSTHEQMVEMEDGSKKIVPVGGTSEKSKQFAKYFDDVVYTELVNKKHRCYSSTTAKMNVLAGSRAGIELGEGDTLLKLFEARK